jgi:hypothetical protein
MPPKSDDLKHEAVSAPLQVVTWVLLHINKYKVEQRVSSRWVPPIQERKGKMTLYVTVAWRKCKESYDARDWCLLSERDFVFKSYTLSTSFCLSILVEVW